MTTEEIEFNKRYTDPPEDAVYNAAFFKKLAEDAAKAPPCDPYESVVADKTVYPKGTLLKIICRNTNSIGLYADGNAGFFERVVTKNCRQCGYKDPIQMLLHKLREVNNEIRVYWSKLVHGLRKRF